VTFNVTSLCANFLIQWEFHPLEKEKIN